MNMLKEHRRNPTRRRAAPKRFEDEKFVSGAIDRYQHCYDANNEGRYDTINGHENYYTSKRGHKFTTIEWNNRGKYRIHKRDFTESLLEFTSIWRDMGRIFMGLDVVLVNLQYGDVDDEIKEFKEETGIDVVQCASVDNREDLDGLAALIEACDMVVSTSNVTIHLAGALAKETWVLLHYVSIYFWLTERRDSIWYPSLTLYRQPTLDDWDSVYASIRKDLDKRLRCN